MMSDALIKINQDSVMESEGKQSNTFFFFFFGGGIKALDISC